MREGQKKGRRLPKTRGRQQPELHYLLQSSAYDKPASLQKRTEGVGGSGGGGWGGRLAAAHFCINLQIDSIRRGEAGGGGGSGGGGG